MCHRIFISCILPAALTLVLTNASYRTFEPRTLPKCKLNYTIEFVERAIENNYLDFIEKKLAEVCEIPDPLADPSNKYQVNPEDIVDFIVVGAGAGGSVVASRLSENSNWNVILVEAGGPEPVGAQAPSMYFSYIDSPIDWAMPIKPMKHACLGKVCKFPRGKVMGGTTVLNGLMYCRGDASNYDDFERWGCDGWSYDDVLPYFLKSENNLQFNSQNHAKGGLLTVSYYNDIPDFGQHIFAAAEELGYRTDLDIGHGILHEGFYRAQMTTRNGARLSTAKAFLRPFLKRKNLRILMNAQVVRVLLDDKKEAYGVVYVKDNAEHVLFARKEVIISAGALMSPHILLHSGIGPAEHLNKIGIPVVADVPGVGKNLRNHVSYQVKAKINTKGLSLLNNITLERYLDYGNGPMSSTGLSQVGAMINSGYARIPNMQVFFSGLQAMKSKTGSENETDEYYREFGISPTVLKTKSIGYIELEDKNPLVYPAIYYNYLSNRADVATILKGIRFAQRVVDTDALKSVGAYIEPYEVEGCEKYKWDTNEFWECAIRHQTNPENHQVGSCKMGDEHDRMAVVNNKLEVFKVKKLRVIDASIFPDLPSGNIMAPTIMVGEKGADMIKDTWTQHLRDKINNRHKQMWPEENLDDFE